MQLACWRGQARGAIVPILGIGLLALNGCINRLGDGLVSTAHRGELIEPPGGDGDGHPASEEVLKPLVDTRPVENRLAVRTREWYAAIRTRRGEGMSISAICWQLNLDCKTVRRFTQAANVEQLLVRARSRASLLDAFKPYLHERFNAGHTDAAALTAEINAMGYRGSAQTVRRYLHPFRATAGAWRPCR